MTAHRAADGRPILRLYNHNVLGRRAGWDARRLLLRQIVSSSAPDVVLFSEEIVTDEYDQTADLVGDGYEVVHSQARSDEERSGISVASRWPVLDHRELDLMADGPPVYEFRWAALLVSIDAPEPFGRTLVVNHFPEAAAPREADRERQAVMVARAVEELVGDDDRLVVLGGDLDADPDAASLRFLTGKQSLDGWSVCYRDAWEVAHPGEPGWTLDPANGIVSATMPGWPYRRIDHLLVRCGSTGMPPVDVVACDRVGVEAVDGVWASDHAGLMTDLAPCPERLDPEPRASGTGPGEPGGTERRVS
ncbi:endonuclease/exonuclease/phosphatase family protein [Promicromonospora sp. NPDC050249]|uniref:endonuclease/exonuclease/phosphatase family protein n=1 Tax=Promicromonospora sp. NPDC050249 TaxID=3154743 RepID=UPI0033D774D1